MIKALKARPSLVFVPFVGNVALYLFLLANGARGTGIFISAIMAAAALLFIYGMLKQGFVVGRGGEVYTIDGAPKTFWAGAIFCFVIYVVVTFAACGFYFQDRARGLIS